MYRGVYRGLYRGVYGGVYNQTVSTTKGGADPPRGVDKGGTPSAPEGPHGIPEGQIMKLIKFGGHFLAKLPRSVAPVHRIEPPGILLQIPGIPRIPGDSWGVLASEPPFHTRRGLG